MKVCSWNEIQSWLTILLKGQEFTYEIMATVDVFVFLDCTMTSL